jgi:uncharacterized RDD family membrane protein YckC
VDQRVPPVEPGSPEPVPTEPPPPAASWSQPTPAANASGWVTDAPPPAGGQPAVMWATPTEPVGPAPGIEFAPHGARLVAYILDSVLVTIIVLAFVIVASVVLFAGTTVEGNQVTAVNGGAAGAFFVILLIGIFLAFLYFPFFWARGGQTLGMKPFGLRVVRDRDGGRIGWGTALLRLVGLWVAGAVFWLGYIWIFVDKRRRGWQDLIAGTVVVRRP